MDLNNGFIYETSELITEAAIAETSCSVFPPGTLLVAMYGGFNQIGRTGLLKISAAINQAISAIQLDEELASPEYLLQYLNGRVDDWRRLAASSRKDPNITRKDVCDFPIKLPPIDEQKKIAEILGTWDAAIGTIEQLIIAKKDLKKALVYKLIINEGNSTKRVSISDVAQINPALEIKLSSRADVTFLGMSDITEDGGMNEGHIRAYEDVCKGYTAFQEDDILIAKITPCFENNKGTWAKSLANRTGFGSTEFHVVRCGSSVNPEFLYQITLSKQFRDKGVSFMTGSAGQKRVPTEFIESYRFNLPSLQEQARICSAMNLVDREIDHLIHTKKSIKIQKQGLMQQLLTGKLPVKTGRVK